jgi:antitoxin FitA
MATLSIRALPDAVRDRLRVRAARAGRSMEAEARAILIETCTEEEPVYSVTDLQQWVDDLYGASRPADVTGELIAQRRAEASRE